MGELIEGLGRWEMELKVVFGKVGGLRGFLDGRKVGWCLVDEMGKIGCGCRDVEEGGVV